MTPSLSRSESPFISGFSEEPKTQCDIQWLLEYDAMIYIPSAVTSEGGDPWRDCHPTRNEHAACRYWQTTCNPSDDRTHAYALFRHRRSTQDTPNKVALTPAVPICIHLHAATRTWSIISSNNDDTCQERLHQVHMDICVLPKP